jgi:hypothetical protein
MALHRLLREEEVDSDLAVHEAVRDELEDLDLARGRLLLQLLEGRLERDEPLDRGVTPRSHRLEPSGVLAVARQDLVAPVRVHNWGIGPRAGRL